MINNDIKIIAQWSNKGKAYDYNNTPAPAGLKQILDDATAKQSSAKHNGRGYAYWMFNIDGPCPMGANHQTVKPTDFEYWNGWHNIDIDLKEVYSELGFIKKDNNSYTITELSLYEEARDEMKRCFDIILAPYYSVGFISSSLFGFNYVCRARCEWADDPAEQHEKSYKYIMCRLFAGIKQMASAGPEHKMTAVIGNLMLKHIGKVLDMSACEFTRKKFASDRGWWTNKYAPDFTISEEQYYGPNGVSLLDEAEKSAGHVAPTKTTVCNSSGDKWDNKDRTEFGRSLPVILGTVQAARDFLREHPIPGPTATKSKERTAEVLGVLKGFDPQKHFASPRGYALYKELCGENSVMAGTEDCCIYINKYMQEKAGFVFSELIKETRLGIMAPTGYGKTYMVAKLAELANSNGMRIIFMAPTNSIANDAAANLCYEKQNDINLFGYAAGMKKADWKFVTSAAGAGKKTGVKYDVYDDADKNIICVYDTGIYTLLNNISTDNSIIIVDESHSIFTTGYRDIMISMRDMILNWNGYIMLMSATPGNEMSRMHKVLYFKKKTPAGRCCEVRLYPNGNQKAAMKIIFNILLNRDRTRQVFVYMSTMNIKKAKEAERSAKEHGFDIYSKDTREVECIVRQDGWSKSDVLFCSAYGQYGINLYPLKKTDIYVFADNAMEAVQAMSRVRNYENVGDIYIYKHNDKRVYKENKWSEYMKITGRDYNELYSFINGAAELMWKPKLDGRAVSEEAEKNRFNDIVMANNMKYNELGELYKYAKMNDIEIKKIISVDNGSISGVQSKYKLKLCDIVSGNLDTEEIRENVNKNDIKTAKYLHATYLGANAPRETVGKIMLKYMESSFTPSYMNQLVQSVKCAMSGSIHTLLLAYAACGIEMDNRAGMWAGWIELCRSNCDTKLGWAESIVDDMRDIIHAGMRFNKIVSEIIAQTYWLDNYAKLTEYEQGEGKELVVSSYKFIGRVLNEDFTKYINESGAYDIKLNDKNLALTMAANIDDDFVAECARLLVNVEDEINEKIEAGHYKILHVKKRGSALKAARAAGGAAGAASGAAGAASGAAGAASGAATSKAVCGDKLIVKNAFIVNDVVHNVGTVWESKREACMAIYGSVNGKKRTKLKQLIDDGYIVIAV